MLTNTIYKYKMATKHNIKKNNQNLTLSMEKASTQGLLFGQVGDCFRAERQPSKRHAYSISFHKVAKFKRGNLWHALSLWEYVGWADVLWRR